MCVEQGSWYFLNQALRADKVALGQRCECSFE